MTAAKSDIAVIVPALGEAVTEATNTRWLKAVGDVVVQRGVRHAWRNNSEQPCAIAFFMIGADPV